MSLNDEKIKIDIIDQLFWDTRVDASNIMVAVEDGVVELSGTVATHTGRRSAELDAYDVAGVKVVKNKLAVMYPEEVKAPSDEDVQAGIKNALLWSSYINSSTIEVGVMDGIATMRGTIDTYWKKLKITELARNVTGVLDVVNEVAIVPTRAHTDQAIAKDVMNAIDRNSRTRYENIDVAVSGGVVSLAGNVSNWKIKEELLEIASCTAGVRDIIDRLQVTTG